MMREQESLSNRLIKATSPILERIVRHFSDARDTFLLQHIKLAGTHILVKFPNKTKEVSYCHTIFIERIALVPKERIPYEDKPEVPDLPWYDIMREGYPCVTLFYRFKTSAYKEDREQ